MSRAQYIKGFYVMNRAWHAQTPQPEIMIGLYHPDGGTSGEFALRWHNLSPFEAAPCLEIFDDAWTVFFAMPELAELAKLRERRRTQDDIIAFLQHAGFQDLTPYADETRVPL